MYFKSSLKFRYTTLSSGKMFVNFKKIYKCFVCKELYILVNIVVSIRKT